jgi:hypothetical protein
MKMNVILIRKIDCKVTEYWNFLVNNEFRIFLKLQLKSVTHSIIVYCYENYEEIILFQWYFGVQMLYTFLIKITEKWDLWQRWGLDKNRVSGAFQLQFQTNSKHIVNKNIRIFCYFAVIFLIKITFIIARNRLHIKVTKR